jgi:uncharacterized protein YacL
MVRSILAVIVGILIGGIVAGLLETPGMFLHPPAPGVNLRDPEEFKAHAAAAPLAALICVAIAWTIGPLVGSFLAARIARRAFLAHGICVGVLFLAAVVFNLRSIPHPAWLMVVGIVSPLAMSWLGSLLAAWSAPGPPTGPQPQDMREKNMAC